MQALLATASVIAMMVIALNLFITFGLLLFAVFYVQRLTRALTDFTERGLARSQPYATKAADTLGTVSEHVVRPVIQVESGVTRLRRVFAYMDPRKS